MNQKIKASLSDWHPADIKAELEKKGWTLRSLAEHHGIKGSSSFSRALDCSMPTNERRIAEAIGVPVQFIWPSRYFQDGAPRQRGRTVRKRRILTAESCADVVAPTEGGAT